MSFNWWVFIRMRPIWVIVALVAAIGCSGPAASVPASQSPALSSAPIAIGDPRPVVIDTDMAADDWLAILYLLKRPEVEVVAVTVTGTGEAHCAPGFATHSRWSRWPVTGCPGCVRSRDADRRLQRLPGRLAPGRRRPARDRDPGWPGGPERRHRARAPRGDPGRFHRPRDAAGPRTADERRGTARRLVGRRRQDRGGLRHGRRGGRRRQRGRVGRGDRQPVGRMERVLRSGGREDTPAIPACP